MILAIMIQHYIHRMNVPSAMMNCHQQIVFLCIHVAMICAKRAHENGFLVQIKQPAHIAEQMLIKIDLKMTYINHNNL